MANKLPDESLKKITTCYAIVIIFNTCNKNHLKNDLAPDFWEIIDQLEPIFKEMVSVNHSNYI